MSGNQKIETDVVVVGTGPGGATVARDMVMKGKRVIMLDWGKNIPPAGNTLGAFRYTGGLNGLQKGFMISKELAVMIRCISVGGTTQMYTGTAWNPPLEMFAKYNIDLSRETEEIRKECNQVQIPENLIGPGAKALMKSARDLGYNWEPLPKFLKSENCVTGCNSCYFGCKRGAKFHAWDWVMDAVSRGAVLMPETLCEEVVGEGDKATGVRAVDKKGREVLITAKVVVIAAGGVGSPVVLQKSGIHEAGQNFFFDPFVLTFGTVDTNRIPLSKEFAMAAGVHLDEGIIITDMLVPWALSMYYASTALKFNAFFKTGRQIGVMTKIRDSLDGSISINGAISKPLSHHERYLLNKGKAISREVLRNLGATDIWYSREAAAHPGGTCRIGAIVDSNLETRYKNLFVCDASVIPEPWGLPPVMSVLCLGRRLSRHLEGSV